VIVVDSNVMFYLQVKGGRTDEARRVYRRDPEWFAPRLWRSEFRNALALYLRRGTLTIETALDSMGRAERAMQGREHDVQSAPVLRLASDSGCSAYDCEYIWLAQDLGVPLVTADQEILAKFRPIARSMQEFCS
jgi:predicted nucleic acid-binding protein